VRSIRVFDLFTGDYKELYGWSVENYDHFWEEFWHYSDIVRSEAYIQVCLHLKINSTLVYEYTSSFKGLGSVYYHIVVFYYYKRL